MEKRRRLVEAVHWILLTGAQWRELPGSCAKWQNIFKRYSHWEVNGIWADKFRQFVQDFISEVATEMAESTAMCAHMCAAVGSKWGKTCKNNAKGEAGVALAAKSITSLMPSAFLYSSS